MNLLIHHHPSRSIGYIRFTLAIVNSMGLDTFIALRILSTPLIHPSLPRAPLFKLQNPVVGGCFKPQDKLGGLLGVFVRITDMGGRNKLIKLIIRNIFLKSKIMFCEVIAKYAGILKTRPGV